MSWFNSVNKSNASWIGAQRWAASCGLAMSETMHIHRLRRFNGLDLRLPHQQCGDRTSSHNHILDRSNFELEESDKLAVSKKQKLMCLHQSLWSFNYRKPSWISKSSFHTLHANAQLISTAWIGSFVVKYWKNSGIPHFFKYTFWELLEQDTDLLVQNHRWEVCFVCQPSFPLSWIFTAKEHKLVEIAIIVITFSN